MKLEKFNVNNVGSGNASVKSYLTMLRSKALLKKRDYVDFNNLGSQSSALFVSQRNAWWIREALALEVLRGTHIRTLRNKNLEDYA